MHSSPRSTPVSHELKSWWQNFRELRRAALRDEVYSDCRQYDRDFRIGDLIVYAEWAPQPPYKIQDSYPMDAALLRGCPPHYFCNGDEMTGWAVVPPSRDQAHCHTGRSLRAVVTAVNRISVAGNQRPPAEDCFTLPADLASSDGYVSLTVRVLQNSTPYTADTCSLFREGKVPRRFVCSVCRAAWTARFVPSPFVDELEGDGRRFELVDGEWGVSEIVGWIRAAELGYEETPEARAAKKARSDAETHEGNFHIGALNDDTLSACSICGHLLLLGQSRTQVIDD